MSGVAIQGVQFQLNDGTLAAGFWEFVSVGVTGGFVISQPRESPYTAYPGDADRHLGLFSMQGFLDCAGELRLAPGTDDPNIATNSFAVPFTVTADSDYCTACGS